MLPAPWPDALNIEQAARHINRNHLTFACSYRQYGVPFTMVTGRPVFFASELEEWNRKNPTVMTPGNRGNRKREVA